MFGKKGKDDLAIFFATDVHGSNTCFKKFVNAGKFYDVQVLILGGDVTGKMVVPIAKQTGGDHLTSFAGKEVRLESPEAVADFGRRIADMGFYPSQMSEEEFRELRADPKRQEELFHTLIRQRLEEWMEFARPRLEATGIRCFAAPGNDDGFFVDEIIQGSGVIELLEMRVVQLDGLEMVSTGPEFPADYVNRLLAAYHVRFESREVDHHAQKATVRYHCTLDPDTPLQRLSEQLTDPNAAGLRSVSWETLRKE